ncbi:hypothetical protein SISNIDRAFT_3965 [Sistotremastrum niveocremeum HHB9708]|uniref:Defective in cullin neddylation protein n=1 Tax=Sistotremastrum niveocremeum HHB9708 TaxID=1314777 RepID=A0A165AFF0_9AGAM|nr:hypothetical protein SISNIDRAFT_3965 [Sistotremastrum niveocremeum HHB9708]
MCFPWARRKAKVIHSPSSTSISSKSPANVPKPTLTNSVMSQVQPKKNTVAPFTASHAATLFEEYRDKDTKGDEEDVIGPEGMEKLCQDAELDMAGAKPILLAWTLGAKEMGKFTRGEWTEGTSRWK